MYNAGAPASPHVAMGGHRSALQRETSEGKIGPPLALSTTSYE